jgi:gamma-glutamyltranspeptidase/glutathione hydrolase
MKKSMKLLAWCLSVLLMAAAAAVVAGLSFRLAVGPVREDMPRRVVYAPNEVVVTSQPLASQAGLDVLRQGGNAVDAAVTAAAVLSVIEPYMTGIGGDMFAILWSAGDQKLIGLNGSGRSGSLMPEDAERAEAGSRSVTIPGALSGWAALLEAHGTITLAEALEPAIALADKGFPVSDVTASEWAVFADRVSYDPNARAVFLVDGERAPAAGEWFSNPTYATTLRLIAREGPKVLYGGELGQRLVEQLQAFGGYVTLEDFRKHEAVWVEPLSVPFGDYRVWELPPNGQGIAVLEMLRLLESYDLSAMGHNSARYLHHVIEAKKLAFADLEYFVGDPKLMAVSPGQLLSDEFVEQRRSLIQPGRALERAQPDGSLTRTDTTYLAVADKAGNMISLINSLADGFGSGVVVSGTGFALQNRAIGFAEPQQKRANSSGPGRLPFHTIIPGFVTKAGNDGGQQPWLAFGIVGGAQQPQAQVQVLLNILVFGMDVQQALDAPRFRHWRGNTVSFETAIPVAVIDELKSMGHAPQSALTEMTEIVTLGRNRGLIFGGGQAIVREQRGYTAGSDSRRDGVAAAR